MTQQVYKITQQFTQIYYGGMCYLPHHGLLLYVQRNIHITGMHRYQDIKLEAIRGHVLKADMSFTVIGIYKAL